MNAILYYKKTFVTDKPSGYHTELDMIMVDANRAFVLYACTAVNRHLAKSEGDKVIELATIAVYDTI